MLHSVSCDSTDWCQWLQWLFEFYHEQRNNTREANNNDTKKKQKMEEQDEGAEKMNSSPKLAAKKVRKLNCAQDECMLRLYSVPYALTPPAKLNHPPKAI